MRKDLSRLFSMRLTPEEAPWAFAKGLPARNISALELLASTVGLILLVPPEVGGAGTVVATGLTDSQVAAAVVSRGMSTAYPLSCVAMELAAQLEERRLDLSLEWIPRGENAEADALADGRVEGFDPALRVGPAWRLSRGRSCPASSGRGERLTVASASVHSPQAPRMAARPRRAAGSRSGSHGSSIRSSPARSFALARALARARTCLFESACLIRRSLDRRVSPLAASGVEGGPLAG